MVRQSNEDFSGALDCSSVGRGSLWLVADGMGGHNGGEVASRLAVGAVLEHYPAVQGRRPDEWLERAFAWANQTLVDQCVANPGLQGMGTTLSALVLLDGHAVVVSVGDSRVYLLRKDGCTQLTEDDTVVASMVRNGELTEIEAAVHPRRNALTKAVGNDGYDGTSAVESIPLENGDIFLLCSDGLYAHVEPREFIPIVASTNIETACANLLKLALARGGSDNITIMLVRAEMSARPSFAEPTLTLIPD